MKKICFSKKSIVYVYCLLIFFQSVFLKIGGLSVNKILFIVLFAIVIYRCFNGGTLIVFGNDVSTKFMYYWLIYTLFLGVFAITLGHFTEWAKLLYVVLVFWVSSEAFKRILNRVDCYVLVFKLFEIGILIQAAVGMYEHITGNYLFTNDREFFMSHPYFIKVKLPCAMQANPNNFAVLMVVGIFIAIACFKMRSSIIKKALDVACVVFFGYTMLISLSRSATLMLGIGLIGGFLLVYGHKLNKKKKNILICVFTVGLVALFYNFNSLVSFLGTYMEFGNTSDSSRIIIYTEGLRELIKTFGIGTGVFYGALHSMWVEVLIEFGIIVFVGFCLFYFRLFRSFRRIALESKEEESAIAVAFYEILFGLVIGSFGPSSTIAMEWIGVLFGVMMAFERYSVNRMSKNG